MPKPADEPLFNICVNASRPDLVHISIGTGMDGYNVTPEFAEELADQLLDVANSLRR